MLRVFTLKIQVNQGQNIYKLIRNLSKTTGYKINYKNVEHSHTQVIKNMVEMKSFSESTKMLKYSGMNLTKNTQVLS